MVETQSVPGAVPIINASTRATESDAEPILRSREDTKTWLASASTAEELSTFHCDRVRKMPMSSLDPSMLLGFLIQDHNDWQDFCARMNTVGHRCIDPYLRTHLTSCDITGQAQDLFSAGSASFMER